MAEPRRERAVARLPIQLGRDPLAIARRIAALGGAWAWLDGEGAPAGEPRVSTFVIASAVISAERGREREFLEQFRPGPPPRGGAGGAGGGSLRRGWVVALSYEFGVALLGVRPAADELPPGFALRAETVLTLDHETGETELTGPSEGELASVARRLTTQAAETNLHRERSTHAWRTSDERYRAHVEACVESIREGDAYVLCLTDSARIDGSPDPIDVYARLRAAGAGARGAVIVAGNRALVSASPERFLSVRGREARTDPIKGTRRRDPDPARDRDLAERLAGDPKERAENLMIVDLMRNDLSRVCVPGTVGVEGFLRVESHPHVHQLVSTVRGRLAQGLSGIDALISCFPGGSMTGAPKRSAVEILAAIEGGPRGLYSGCFGWVDEGGDLELAMSIRGVEFRGASGPGDPAHMLIGAGGGITADSDPERELAERDLKAAALIAAACDPVN